MQADQRVRMSLAQTDQVVAAFQKQVADLSSNV